MASTSDAPRRACRSLLVARASWPAALLVAVAAGCAREPEIRFAPVEGTVTRNGKPVPRAQVVFLADGDTHGPRATGVTDDAGRYRLTADDGQNGAPVGRHRVCVIDTTLVAERLGLVAQHLPNKAAEKAPVPKVIGKPTGIPAGYGRPAETPLRAEVKPEPQTIDFQIP